MNVCFITFSFLYSTFLELYSLYAKGRKNIKSPGTLISLETEFIGRTAALKLLDFTVNRLESGVEQFVLHCGSIPLRALLSA